MIGYWESWASRFQPDVVLIYPNAFFYLNLDEPPSSASSSGADAPRPHSGLRRSLYPRFILRLRGSFSFPKWFQAWRDQRSIDHARASHPGDWPYTAVPEDRVQWFLQDLDLLTRSVQAAGHTPVVMTHPIRVLSDERVEDSYDLRHMQSNYPRATVPLLLQHARDVNREIRRFCRSRGIDVIDLATVLDGNRDAFTDMVHFNDRGSRIAAEQIAGFIMRRFPGRTTRDVQPNTKK
jgi:hypothetical protein